jgi:hypothetical protein
LEKIGNIVYSLYVSGFLKKREIDNDLKLELVLAMPSIFRIDRQIIESFLKNIVSTEEKGGILFIKPQWINNVVVFLIDEINYLSNTTKRNQKIEEENLLDFYLFNKEEYNYTILNVQDKNSLPIEFKILPIQSLNQFESIGYFQFQNIIDKHNEKHGEIPLMAGNQKVFLPRCLIFGNTDNSTDIFIGFYNGYIKPVNYTTLKNLIFNENINKTAGLNSHLDFEIIQQ